MQVGRVSASWIENRESNHRLSDAVGFDYQRFPDPAEAARAFVGDARAIGRELEHGRDGLLTVF